MAQVLPEEAGLQDEVAETPVLAEPVVEPLLYQQAGSHA